MCSKLLLPGLSKLSGKWDQRGISLLWLKKENVYEKNEYEDNNKIRDTNT